MAITQEQIKQLIGVYRKEILEEIKKHEENEDNGDEKDEED